MDIVGLLRDDWKLIVGIVILLILLFLIIYISWEKQETKKRVEEGLLVCPIRGLLWTRKYDARGNYTEEYQRIRLIRYLLAKRGKNGEKLFDKSQFVIEYSIPIGHKGHNSLRVDLVIRKNNNFSVVAEVKKDYSEVNRNSAIKHQLIPAMQILNSKYGIYFDGTRKSCLLVRNSDGTLFVQEFP